MSTPEKINSFQDPNKDVNRSSALTPELLALVNQATSAAVKEALAGLGPIIEKMALTPEKIAEAERIRRTPTDKEIAATRRAEREGLLAKEDMAAAAAADARRKANCAHVDANGRIAVRLVHNFPDHQARGICPMCGDWIHPREWQIMAPDEKHPRGRPVVVDAHKDYGLVMRQEHQNNLQGTGVIQ